MGSPVTVECPLCQAVMEVEEYDSITRTDVLVGHIAERHASQLLPQRPSEGPPFPRLFKIKWPWRREK